MPRWKGLEFRSSYKPGDNDYWNRTWEHDPTQISHAGGWDWMDISKKKDLDQGFDEEFEKDEDNQDILEMFPSDDDDEINDLTESMNQLLAKTNEF